MAKDMLRITVNLYYTFPDYGRKHRWEANGRRSALRLRPAEAKVHCVAIAVWLTILLATTGCTDSKPTMAAPDLYRLHCSSCHGDGSGNGHVAATLKAKPRNLRLESWQDSVNDEHIRRVISGGGASVALNADMPAFKDKLSRAEIRSLVQYVRQLGE